MTDREGVFTFVNPRFEQVYGFSAAEVIGRATPRILKGGEVSDERYRTFWQQLHRGEPLSYAFRNRTKDGRLIDIEATVSPIRNQHNTVVGYLATQRDVTARRRAEAALSASQARLQLISDNVLDLVAQITPDGTFLYASPSYHTVLGYDSAALVGQSALALIHPDDLPHVLSVLQATLQSGTNGRVEFRYRHADGHYVWLETVGKVVTNDGGKPIGLVVSSRDLTERKRNEDILRQSQKLEAIGSLAGGIAHDFNNLLTSILGYADLAIGEVDADHPVVQDLQEIVRAGRSAEALTRQLLIFTRKSVVQPRLLHLNDIVPQVEKMLRRMVGEHITFEVQLGDGLGAVRIDPGQLEQILMNLVVNARDAMPGGGSLIIRTFATDARGGRRDGVAVVDTGHGMTSEIMARIFDPFFTTKSPEKGTGLGLAIVHRIVEGARGELTVESIVGQGTTFTVLLPRAGETPDADRQDQSAGETPRGTETILFVEDHESIRRMAARALKRLGYSVVTARDGADALQRLSQLTGRLDLLVTDVAMPGMSGGTLAEKVRAARPYVKVIFASGFAGDAELVSEVQATNGTIVRKPYTPDGLARTIRQVLDS